MDKKYREIFASDGLSAMDGTSGTAYLNLRAAEDYGIQIVGVDGPPPPEDIEWVQTHDGTAEVYRFTAERLSRAEVRDGWWDLTEVASSCGQSEEDLIALVDDADPEKRFWFWYAIGSHYGFGELDHDPLAMLPKQADLRFDPATPQYQIDDQGAEHAQYFRGTNPRNGFTRCVTGSGNNPREAFEDALSQIPEDERDFDSDAIRKEAAEALSDESDIPLIEEGDGDEDAPEGSPHPEWHHYVSIYW